MCGLSPNKKRSEAIRTADLKPLECACRLADGECAESNSHGKSPQITPLRRLTVELPDLGWIEKEVTAMDENPDDKWLTRQDLADRYGLPVKTPAEWASKGTGPRYAKFGRHVRYLLSDVIDWERKQFAEGKRDSA